MRKSSTDTSFMPNDIALAELDCFVEALEYTQLPTHTIAPDSTVYAAGWGVTRGLRADLLVKKTKSQLQTPFCPLGCE